MLAALGEASQHWKRGVSWQHREDVQPVGFLPLFPYDTSQFLLHSPLPTYNHRVKGLELREE